MAPKGSGVDRMTELELFVHTAELNSMSQAAEPLGLSSAHD
jgi:DNA-binding transcriptional LysR family regulator